MNDFKVGDWVVRSKEFDNGYWEKVCLHRGVPVDAPCQIYDLQPLHKVILGVREMSIKLGAGFCHTVTLAFDLYKPDLKLKLEDFL